MKLQIISKTTSLIGSYNAGAYHCHIHISKRQIRKEQQQKKKKTAPSLAGANPARPDPFLVRRGTSYEPSMPHIFLGSRFLLALHLSHHISDRVVVHTGRCAQKKELIIYRQLHSAHRCALLEIFVHFSRAPTPAQSHTARRHRGNTERVTRKITASERLVCTSRTS